jgi:subtilisin family serine protease
VVRLLFAVFLGVALAEHTAFSQPLEPVAGQLDQAIEVEPGLWFLGPGPGEMLQTTNLNAADTSNANQLWAGGGLGLNLTGAGTTVGLWDGGDVRATHQELNGRVSVIDAVGLSDHATHVAGTIGATGVNAAARGMASSVDIRSRDFNNDTAEMMADMNNGLIDLSNHSYGRIRGWISLVWNLGVPESTWFADRSRYTTDPNFGKYDSYAQQIDSILNQHQDVLSVWAASNDRDDQFTNQLGNNTYVTYLSAGPAGAGFYRVTNAGVFTAPGIDGNFDCLPNGGQTAKNTLVVGAINDITADPYNNGNVVMSGFSSWGPTDDGRIGVDVVTNGVGLTSSIHTADNAYASFSGTSMATPTTTGSLALVREHTINEKGAAPTAATLKGLAIHTAFDSGNTGPDYTYGWGVLDVAAAANFVTNSEAVIPTDFIYENSYNGTDYELNVIAGAGPLKATLVWQDIAGVALTSDIATAVLNDPTSALTNDLNLWVEDLLGNIYYPWNLNPAVPLNAAFRTALNHRDNEEQVLIDLPLAGVYTVHVGHTGGNFMQNYSLLLSGVYAVPEPASSVLVSLCFAMVPAHRRRRQ